jgi:hypothetical protein
MLLICIPKSKAKKKSSKYSERKGILWISKHNQNIHNTYSIELVGVTPEIYLRLYI